MKNKSYDKLRGNVAILYPHLLKEVHPTLNGNLKLEDFTPGSGQEFIWIHEGILAPHIWSAHICKRTLRGDGCPICVGQKIHIDTCLETKNPEFIKEWDFKVNYPLTPRDVHYGSNKKFGWVCSICQLKYISVVYNRTIKGQGCPHCSGKKPSAIHCLEIDDSIIADEWDYEDNFPLTPKDVVSGSNKKYGWICKNCGHKWKNSIAKRTKRGQGCPKCFRSISSQQIFVFSQIKYCFPDAELEYKIEKYKIDIYIPSESIAIEIDGYPWHKDRLKSDQEKQKKLNEKGIHVLRIRDERLPKLNNDDVIACIQEKKFKLSAIKTILNKICEASSNTNELAKNYVQFKFKKIEDLPNWNLCLKLNANNLCHRPNNSISKTHPKLTSEWVFVGNRGPANVTAGSAYKATWKCPIDGELWQCAVNERTRTWVTPRSCPKCKIRKNNRC